MAVNDRETQQHPQHSYIRRRGRMTRAQSKALQEHTSAYSINPEQVEDFAGDHHLGIEIGYGMGHALLEWAVAAPTWRLCGIELYQPGIGSMSDGLHRAQVQNVRLLEQPAQQVVAALGDGSVSQIRIFFPDPWPKKRHQKRRLIQPGFIAEISRVLHAGGTLRLATDWAPYAQWMRECLQSETSLAVKSDHTRAADPDMADRAERTEMAASLENTASVRQTTKFERRGERLGHDIHDLVCTKVA